MSSRFGKGKSDDVFFWDEWHTKGMEPFDEDENYVVTVKDIDHAILVLADFTEMEPDFCSFLRDNDNWEIEGESEGGNLVKTAVIDEAPCGCDD